MQSKTGKQNIFFTLILSVIFLTSCEKEEAIVTNDELSVEKIQQATEIDVTSDTVASIIEEVYTQESDAVEKSSDTFLPECMTKTVEFNGDTRTINLTFEGDCEMQNRNILSGIITFV